MTRKNKLRKGARVSIVSGARAGRTGTVEKPAGQLGLVRILLDPQLQAFRIGLELVIEPSENLVHLEEKTNG